MLKQRIIPGLLISNGGLVKTQQFSKPKYVGDPVNAIRIFNDKEVDELMVLDIDASRKKQPPNYALIEEFASECFMPLCYGGGINSLSEAKQLFKLGVEKICLQTSALENISIVNQIATQFGSQSVVVSVDIKENWLGKKKIYGTASRKYHSIAWQEYLKELVIAGVGEILLNSVNRDGMQAGMDISLIQEASSLLPVPLIAMGGVGSLQHIKEAIHAGASAVAAGSYFVFQGPHRAVLISYPKYKDLEKLLTIET